MPNPEEHNPDLDLNDLDEIDACSNCGEDMYGFDSCSNPFCEANPENELDDDPWTEDLDDSGLLDD